MPVGGFLYAKIDRSLFFFLIEYETPKFRRIEAEEGRFSETFGKSTEQA